MKTSPVFAFQLICFLLGKMAPTTLSSSVDQESGFVSAKTGDKITLQCFYVSDIAARVYWYKQTLGQKPKVVSTFYMYDKNASFYNEFKNDPRFSLFAENSKNHLTITDSRTSDSATYYCINCFLNTLEILESKVVIVEGSGETIPTLVHQSASETIQPGGSMTLNCTVQTGICDEVHSVHWFKTSGENYRGLIYTHGSRKNQCEMKPNMQTQTCVYNLPLKSLNLSHAGTYYCAVASCGHILFGNGTRVVIEEEVGLVYIWRGALAFTTLLSILLAFSMCMMKRKNSCLSSESAEGGSATTTTNTKGCQNTDRLYYAALSVDLQMRSRRLRDATWSKCVYHGIKQ